MRKCAQDRIKNRVKMLAHIVGEEPQHQVTVFLQQQVFAPVAAIGTRRKKLGASLAAHYHGHCVAIKNHRSRLLCAAAAEACKKNDDLDREMEGIGESLTMATKTGVRLKGTNTVL